MAIDPNDPRLNPPDGETNEELSRNIRALTEVIRTLVPQVRELSTATDNARVATDSARAAMDSMRAATDRLRAPSNATAPPGAPGSRPGGDQSVPPPMDPGRGFFDNILNIAKSVFVSFGRQIESRQAQARADDYLVGQMSRRYNAQGGQSLASYRQRIHDLGVGTGMSFEESLSYTNMAGRYGTGTYRAGSGRTSSTGGVGTFDQGNQLKYATQAAFDLGLNRQQFQSTLTTLGSAGAVGALGAAGGQKQDYRQFAITMAETLASGRLFDRMDDVMKSVESLSSDITQRGGIVDAQQLASAFASANLAAVATGSARLQEQAPQAVADISRISASQMHDPQMFAAFLTSQRQGSTKSLNIGDVLDFEDTMAGGDILKQSQVFLARYNQVGGNAQLLQGNARTAKEIAEQDQVSGVAIFEMSKKLGMSPNALMDRLRMAQGVASEQGQEQVRQMRGTAQYQKVLSEGNAGTQQLYSKIALGTNEDLQAAINDQVQKMKTNIPQRLLKAAGGAESKLYNAFEEQQKNLAAGGDANAARQAIMEAIAASPASTMVGSGNQLENSFIQNREFGVAVDAFASSVEQFTAAIGYTRGKADLIRNFGPGSTTEIGKDPNVDHTLRTAIIGGSAVVASKIPKENPNSFDSVTQSIASVLMPIAAARLGQAQAAGSRAAATTATGRAIGGLNSRIGLKTVGATAVVGAASKAGAELADSTGHTQIGAGLDILGDTANAALVGATLGSIIPGVGTAVGAGVAGTAGFLYSTYKNWDKLRGKPEQPTTPEQTLASADGANVDALEKAAMDQMGIMADMNTNLSKIVGLLEGQANTKTNPQQSGLGGGSGIVDRDMSTFRSATRPAGQRTLTATGASVVSASGGAPRVTGRGAGSAAAVGADSIVIPTTPVSTDALVPKQEWRQAIADAAKIAGVDPAFIMGMMEQESRSFNPNITSSEGAIGLMQIQPQWIRAAMKNAGLNDLDNKSDEQVKEWLKDPENSIRGSGAMILLKRKEQNIEGFSEEAQKKLLGAYFGWGDGYTPTYQTDGYGRVQRYRAIQKPPAETGGTGGASGRFIPILRAGQSEAGAGVSITGEFWSMYNNPLFGRQHDIGVDLSANIGDKLLVPANGTVLSIQDAVSQSKQIAEGMSDPVGNTYNANTKAYGNSIAILDEEGTIHRLSHASALANFKVGQKVTAGELLGLAGDTGATTGPHLDYEGMHKDAAGNWQLLNMTEWVNGNWQFAPHQGATDERPGAATVIDENLAAQNKFGTTSIIGQPNSRLGGKQQGGGSGVISAGSGDASQQLQVVIKLEQDEQGRITGRLSGDNYHVLAFNNGDQIAANKTGKAPIWVVNPRVDNYNARD